MEQSQHEVEYNFYKMMELTKYQRKHPWLVRQIQLSGGEAVCDTETRFKSLKAAQDHVAELMLKDGDIFVRIEFHKPPL